VRGGLREPDCEPGVETMTNNEIAAEAAEAEAEAEANAVGRRFLRSTHGNVAIIFGLMVFVVTACIGGAVDYGRWLNVNRHTQNAVDAAVIAASRVAQQSGDATKALDTANEYYAQAKSTLGASDGVMFVPDPARPHGWKVSGQGAVPTPFLSIVGITELAVKPKASASVALGGSGDSSLEISLMLDLTGSMCVDGSGPCTTDPKMVALKKAAKDLINTVVPDVQGTSTSRVALVPFAGQIRVGADGSNEGAQMMKKLTNLNKFHNGFVTTGWECGPNNDQWYVIHHSGTGGSWTSEGGGGGPWDEWKCDTEVRLKYSDFNWQVAPCVTDRFKQSQWDFYPDQDGHWNLTDQAPGPNNWLNSRDGERMPLSQTSSDIPPTAHTGALVNGVRTPEQVWWNGSYAPNGECWGSPVNNIIMPLSSDKAALNARIDGFAAYGPTGGPMATQWAWYMLSPNWNSIWTGASEPAPYSDTVATTSTGAAKVKKVAILMTDGVYNTFRSWSDSSVDRQIEMSGYAQKVCREMKAAGITIYTIGFGLNELPDADRERATTTLKECSSNHTIEDGSRVFNFYNANSAAALQGAYADIGQQLTKLRLTE
jgi:Putative Flp pilus-assembly TadE/G-like